MKHSQLNGLGVVGTYLLRGGGVTSESEEEGVKGVLWEGGGCQILQNLAN